MTWLELDGTNKTKSITDYQRSNVDAKMIKNDTLAMAQSATTPITTA
eukprot:CAMPEP_0172312438 /NCGR_PEP_ID=MMETSP1058-20130122/17518_1 /TAXON_ID=83371 /ORGANISM="Detonula confervacea, Strain CCMP 353" /LENGTH=46 /DNA_ID= /DNA_START= /DNA_END= /DNA_ORIENTATION=